MEMVELSLIEEASYRKELHELIRQHYLYTGSNLARTMLDDWNRYVDEFIQIVPIEYKKVLQEEQMRNRHSAMLVLFRATSPEPSKANLLVFRALTKRTRIPLRWA